MTDSKSCAGDGGQKMVEVMYDYSYKPDSDQENVSFTVGEEYYLLAKTSENWWYVKKRQEDQLGVYVPAQYVKEVRVKKPKTIIPPASAPVTDSKPTLKSPKLLKSNSQLDKTPSLNKGAIEELDKLLDDLKVPEAFEDAEQTPLETAKHSNGNGVQTATVVQTPTVVHRSQNPPADNPLASEAPEKSPSDRQSKEETRVESETSDYKTDSRESLDSEGRGFDAGEEMTDVKVTEEVVEVKGRDVVIKSESMDDYANLEEIQKAIRSRAEPPPLADNFNPLLQGYNKPYQEQSYSSQIPSKRVEELEASASTEMPLAGKKVKDSEPGFSTTFVTPTSKRKSIFSSRKSTSVGVQLVKFAATTTPPNETQPREPQWVETKSDEMPSSPGWGDESSPQDLRASKILLQPKMVDKQGSLQKAKVEENSKKMKKSWSPCYAVLCQNLLYFYKDMKSSSSTKPRSINSLGKPEFIVDLSGSKITSAPEDKNVKKDAFMLLTTTKTHFLLFHDDSDNILHWKQSIQNNISALEAGLVPDNSGSLGKYKPEVTFGSSLVAICEREKGKVPRFVKECVLAIEERGLTVDGLYRVSGNVASVQKLRSMVDHNEYYNLHDPTWDVHTITGALKLFFRELAEPLFTFKHFQSFLNALNNLNALKDLIKQLPVVHQKTMKFLFKHFTKVLEHSRDNRMNVQGMAIVFGPTLLWPENASKDSNLALSLMQQGQLVEFVINNCKTLFG